MSSTFSKNNKEYSGVKVVPASFVWAKDNGKFKLRTDIDIVGKVESSMSNFILKANNENRKTKFIDDTCSLTSRTKNEIVGFFYDKTGKRTKNTVAYLVRTDSKAKGSNNKKKYQGRK